MTYQRLPETVVTLYAELLDHCIHLAASEAGGEPLSGSFTSKTIKGRTYWYLQRSEGQRKRQVYLGPDSPALREWMDRIRSNRLAALPDRERRRSLCAMLSSGGAPTEPAAIIKVLQLLSESRVFALGGVLVGTLAFRSYATALGVRFEKAALQTQDIDIAHDPVIGVALAGRTTPPDVAGAITGSDAGFFPVPALDPRQPSTSFKIRGRDLRIDFLTPLHGAESSAPVYLPAYGLSAQPVRFLEYLTENPMQAAVVGTDAVLVNIPDPARFALHKLWTSTRRSPTFQTRALKDRLQAGQLIEVLLDDRPADLAAAWRSIGPHESIRRAILAAAEQLEQSLRSRLGKVVPC